MIANINGGGGQLCEINFIFERRAAFSGLDQYSDRRRRCSPTGPAGGQLRSSGISRLDARNREETRLIGRRGRWM